MGHYSCPIVSGFHRETRFELTVRFRYLISLYIELTISFLIGRNRTVNFWNQRLGRNLAADYTIIMWRTLKVTSNHVTYDRSAWFLRVIMSSSRALFCLPSVKKQKHDFQLFQVCFVDQAGHRKNSWRQGHKTQKGRRRWLRSCCWLPERERTQRTWGKERVDTNFENIHFMSKRERKNSLNV